MLTLSNSDLDVHRRNAEQWLARLAKQVRQDAQDYWKIGVVLVTIPIVIYFPLLVDLIFTNHTLPNVELYRYPTYKTTYEGRWMADIIIQIFGSAGVMQTHFIIGSLIKVFNIIIFCKLFLYDRNSFLILIVGLLISLHPAFLDYYAFVIDATSFELGDTFALLGTMALRHIRKLALALLLSASLYALSLATYQPKLGMIALLLTLLLIHQSMRPRVAPDSIRNVPEMLGRALASFTLAICLYSVSLMVTLKVGGGERRNINNFYEIVNQIFLSYDRMFYSLYSDVDFLPKTIFFLPALCIFVAIFVSLRQSAHQGWIELLICAVAVVALPCAIHLIYIANAQTWENAGRILFPHAYLLGFSLTVFLNHARLRWAGIAAIAVLAYFFAIVGNHEANSAAIKNIFETSKMTRIVARIEQTLPLHQAATLSPLVVIGYIPTRIVKDAKRFPNRFYGSPYQHETFADFRQVVITNFFLGNEAVRVPSVAERSAALSSAVSRPSWPSEKSVYLLGDTIVVVLAPPGDRVPATWPERN